MKKTGAILTTLTIAILFISLISISQIKAQTNNSTNGTTQSTDKIQKGFQCLEDKVADCTSLTTQELALTILATPTDSTFNNCVNELKKRESGGNWGNERDTAMAILALEHAGEDTSDAENWLLGQEKTPTDLIWFIQQDSDGQTQCNFNYNSNSYSINIGENKKIDKDAGSCLERAQSNFWLKVSPQCYEYNFSATCDKDFAISLTYKDRNFPTIYVLEGTSSSSSYGSLEIKIKSKCFGRSSCEYEATAWSALALLKTGHNIEEYIPYIVAMSDSNEKYLPNAFIYMVTGFDDYASQLIAEQKLGDYWQAEGTAYNRFYDTSLALLSLGVSSSEQIQKAKDWLLFSQGSNGCWQNSIRDTAMVLWSLEGRAGKKPGTGTTIRCTDEDFFCIPRADCPSNEQRSNYFCPAKSAVCCEKENLKSCSEYQGTICAQGKICSGNERKATDTDSCCTGECIDKPTETQCESMNYFCKSSCSDTQEVISYTCNQGQVCCRTKTSTGGGLGWLFWTVLILIIILLLIFAWLFREKLKLFFFKFKTGFKKDKGRGPSGRGPGGYPPRPGMPPRPGFPPIRRPTSIPPVQQRRPLPKGKDKDMSDTFDKLRKMSQ